MAVKLRDGKAVEIENFQVGKFLAVYVEPHRGDMTVETFVACRAGIDVQHTGVAVGHHLEDMGMPGNEEIWLLLHKARPYLRFIAPGITAYVRHEHFAFFASEYGRFGYMPPEQAVVYIAVYGYGRAKGRNFLPQGITAYVACMPDTGAGFEELSYLPEEYSVRVG